MPDPGFDARLRFLDKSARLLNGTAPTTSAHLMLERNTIAEEHGKALSKAQLQDICKACGSTILALTFDPINGDNASPKGKNDGSTPDHVLLSKESAIECRVCRRRLMTPPTKSSHYSKDQGLKTAASADPSGIIAFPSSRQDIMNAEISMQSSSTGLNLMDLIKEV